MASSDLLFFALKRNDEKNLNGEMEAMTVVQIRNGLASPGSRESGE